ncbi:MAG: ABC transporter substrate-binding protein [Tomitella sp.]|nr:ABC transporter substrate-binding protein [Tomitella sp.]
MLLAHRRGRAAALAVSAVATLAFVSACAGESTPPVGSDGIPRSTTRIAGAPVLGNAHDPAEACAPEVPLDAGADPALDARRIAVVGDAALDTLCALGLQNRVVALAAPSGAAPIRYLGGWVAAAPSAGSAEHPDLAAVRDAEPDLILADLPDAPSAERAAGANTRTVAVPASGPWADTVGAVATSLGRSDAARERLDHFAESATTVGTDIAASQTQASVIRFTGDGIDLLGPSSFAGQVLARMGVHRPPDQRFESPAIQALPDGDLDRVEGDVLYVALAGKDSGKSDTGSTTPGLRHGEEVMDSDAWQLLDVTENRTFTVDDGIWVRGRGLVAARDIVGDVQASLNRYS